MRVAITQYIARSIRGEESRFWGSSYAQSGELENLKDQPAYFSAEWGKLLVRHCGFYTSPQPRGAVCFSSSKGYTPFVSFDGERAYETDALQIARHAFVSGPVLCPVAACATGAHALALGAQLIEQGRADLVLAGASEPPQPAIILAAYRNMGALSKSGVMRPFDARRDGFVPASGGALFVLESEEFARKRGAKIHGFLTGYSMMCDAHHMTSMSPGGQGIARAIEAALRQAAHPKIDYINAHGTATINDAIESRAIHAVFGNAVPLSSTKAQTGHLLGAAGAVEAAICLLAMRDNFAPPTLNLEQPDGGFDLDYIPLHGREMAIDAVLSLNYGFGGHIGALVFEKN